MIAGPVLRFPQTGLEGFVGWLSRMLGAPKPVPQPVPKPRPPRRKPLSLSRPAVVIRTGSYPTNAVGESYRQEALERICGGYRRDAQDLECEAQLVPDPGNPHDPNAVRVEIDATQVGFLGRDDAARYVSELASAGLAGRTVHCAAKIVGGWKTNQHDAGHFGVCLAIPKRGTISFET